MLQGNLNLPSENPKNELKIGQNELILPN